MGIPSFLRLMLEKYPQIHSWNPEQIIDHLFIDANSILYNIHHSIDKSKSMSNSQYETLLINNFIDYIKFLIKTCNVKKQVYIALDGSAPRAKMVQQRARRYKGVFLEQVSTDLKKKHNVENDKVVWSTQNITPGTQFIFKLGETVKKYVSDGHLSSNKNIKITVSDSNVPGEGEHKIMPSIRSLKGTDDVVGLYSPDADMIILSLTVEKNNILIIRTPPDNKDIEEKYQYKKSGVPFIYVSIDKYRDAFINEIMNDIGIDNKWNKIDVINSYIFLSFLSGNDFVHGFSYLKVKEESPGKSGGLRITLDIYKKILTEKKEQLITFVNDIPNINTAFLKEIFLELSKNEDYYMRKNKQVMEGIRDGNLNQKIDEREATMSEFDKEWTRFQHKEVFNPQHPDYQKYKHIVNIVDTRAAKNVWKEQYYNYYFGISMKNSAEYNRVRSEVCLNYLESLVFTLQYYFGKVPSWTYYYRYRMPPVASDVFTNLDRFIPDVNKLKFNQGKPYTPLQQLMLTLPPQMKSLVPKQYGELMDGKLLPFYPIAFELDYLSGQKVIYSEPILPLIYDDSVLPELAKVKLTKSEKDRNTLVNEPLVYG